MMNIAQRSKPRYRLTARAGTPPPSPIALLPGAELSPLEDAAERRELDVRPWERLIRMTFHDIHMARRHWPEYRAEVVGIDVNTIIDGPIEGPIHPAEGYEATTYGRTVLLLRARIFWRDSLMFAQFLWRRGWPEVRESIEGFEHKRNDYEERMVRLGLDLAKGMPPSGRTPDGREQELDRLADIARRWARAKNYSVDDVTWVNLALTDSRNQKKMQEKASKRGIGIEDVRQRARERDAWRIEPK